MRKLFTKLITFLIPSKASSSGHDKSIHQEEILPRNQRVNLSTLHRVTFLQGGSSTEAFVQVANISSSGIGLMRDGPFKESSTQSSIEGKLRIETQEFELILKEEWRSSQIIGCSIQKVDPAYFTALRSYFRSEMAGLNMKQIKSEQLQAPSKGIPYFFYGQNNCELYYVLEGTSLVSFTLCFFGNYIEGKPGGSLQFGQVKEDHNFEKPNYKESQLVYSSSTPQTDTLSEVIRFIESIQGMSLDAKKNIYEQIQKYIQNTRQ